MELFNLQFYRRFRVCQLPIAVGLLLPAYPLHLHGRADSGSYLQVKEEKLWLEGDSTLHPYTVEAEDMAVAAEIAEGQRAMLLKPGKEGPIARLEVTIPVEHLKSGKEKLDKNLYKALNAKEHPTILFQLTATQIVEGPSEDGTYLATAKGRLSIAGQEREIDLQIRASTTPEGLRIEGEKQLLMTDFGIKPPSMMLGMLKTKDEITVRFRLLFGLPGSK